MSERLDSQTQEWPLRPWIMAAICAVAGLIFNWLTEHPDPAGVPPIRQAAATFVGIATLSFVITVERRRWLWSLTFAVGWGTVVALVGWFTARYNVQPTIFEWPFLSGIFAVLIAAPLFQTVRDEGAWRFPYERLHGHAWMDAVIGAESLFFTGVSFLLAWLIAGLFSLIGIDLLKDLLQEQWFSWMLAGFAFGGSVGHLRERDALLGTLQRLVMVVFSVLAPVFAVALALFLASLPFTGLQPLWESAIPATPLLLVAGAGAVLLANAVIGNGKPERLPNPVLQWSALALVMTVLPLAIVAALSIGQRIGQYGWTPERIWGVIAVAVAIAYGVAGWWSVFKRRRDFDDALRPMQTGLAIGLCGLAVFLALPILDFGAISARSQLARLEAGKTEPVKFDWAAMAFDFGPTGRKALQRIAQSGPAKQRPLAAAALSEDDRWGAAELRRAASDALTLDQRLRPLSPDIRLDDGLKQRIAQQRLCPEDARCAVLRVDANRVVVIASQGQKRRLTSAVLDLSKPASPKPFAEPVLAQEPEGVDLGKARIELREVSRKQLYVDGKPVGAAFE